MFVIVNFSLFTYFCLADAASNRSQQMKKTTETKKLMDESDEPNVACGSSSTSTKIANKEEDDVYEFKTTPKDSSSSGDDKSDGGKGSDKSSDEKSDDQGAKRSYSDIEGDGDDEVKRKKRKDGTESNSKDTNKGASNRTPSQRQEKNSKILGAANKNANLANKNAATLERKSPCASPKPARNDSDAEMDDKSSDAFNSAGPKVPPLKIVIPQQTSNAESDTGARNGKNNSTRSHAALPYVVASSSNSNDSVEKESTSSRCTSPSDSTKSIDDKKLAATLANEEQKQQQRVLRSSNRGGQSVDRGSNNSSPQMQSNSPSPAPAPQASTSTSMTTSTATLSTSIEASDNTKTSTISSTPANTIGNIISPNTANANSESENIANAPSPSASSTSSTKETVTVELHPRKRKIRASKDENKQACNTNQSSSTTSNDTNENVASNEIHPHDQPITNCYQMYLNIRKQIERRHRSLFPVQPKPPQGFKDYLMNRRTYVMAGKTSLESVTTFPSNLATQLKELFTQQEKDRHKLKMQHVVEKEKLVLAVEQEILRVHGRAARALANQSLPFSVCTILKDEEVYNMITPEQEEKDRNARSRYNGRLFLSWLQDVDDKWEKIKVSVLFKQENK